MEDDENEGEDGNDEVRRAKTHKNKSERIT